MRRTKWLFNVLDKVTTPPYKGGKFTYYGHEIDGTIGYGNIDLCIDFQMWINVDYDMCTITMENVPRNYIAPIVDSLNELYANRFKKIRYNNYENFDDDRGYFITYNWFNKTERKNFYKELNTLQILTTKTNN